MDILENQKKLNFLELLTSSNLLSNFNDDIVESFLDKDEISAINYLKSINCDIKNIKEKEILINDEEIRVLNKISPRTYWTYLGFINSTLNIDPLDQRLIDDENYEVIFNDVKKHNSIFFKNFYSEKTMLNSWTIDGLCATGKSSSFSNIKKTNNYLNCIGQNLHVSGNVGYFFSSLKIMEKKEDVLLWDRTPYNNIFPWIFIWMILSDIENNKNLYEKEKDNSFLEYINEFQKYFLPHKLSDFIINRWKNIFSSFHASILDFYVSLNKTILIVDSNEESAIERLSRRNEGCDKERSKWKFYITIQNFAYMYLAQKYPKNFCILDLNYFNGDQTVMQNIILKIITTYNIKEDEKKLATKRTLFKPLSPTFKKNTYTKQYRLYERLRPIQQLKFHNNLKKLNLYNMI